MWFNHCDVFFVQEGGCLLLQTQGPDEVCDRGHPDPCWCWWPTAELQPVTLGHHVQNPCSLGMGCQVFRCCSENLSTTECATRVIQGLGGGGGCALLPAGTGKMEATRLRANTSCLQQPGCSVARAAAVGLGDGSVVGPMCHVFRGAEQRVPCSYSGVHRPLKPALIASCVPKPFLPLAQTTSLAHQEVSIASYNHQS